MTVRVKAYAKINLHLDVTGKRSDGYHDVQTVMQSISLCDTVDVELSEFPEIKIECDKAEVPLGEKNIAHKAARAFLDKTGVQCGVRISIKKNIPMAAGLAGGSADAAAVLVGLNILFDDALSFEALCELGSLLGADVPFCIACGCMYSDGKGDRLSDFLSIPSDTVFVVACGGKGVSTPEAYKLLDGEYDCFLNYNPKGVEELKKTLSSDAPNEFYKRLFNIFEEPISRERATVGRIKNIMLDAGARAAMMSGSGPSVFAVFEKISDAECAVKAINEKGFFASVAFPVGARVFPKK